MLTNTTVKTKCDVKDCKNPAEFAFETKGRQGRCYLCEACLEQLLNEGRKLRVPKSPKNAIKKQLDRRAEEQSYAE